MFFSSTSPPMSIRYENGRGCGNRTHIRDILQDTRSPRFGSLGADTTGSHPLLNNTTIS